MRELIRYTGVLLVARECTAIDCLKSAGLDPIKRTNDQGQMMFEDVPFNRGQSHDSNIPPGQALLVGERLIAG